MKSIITATTLLFISFSSFAFQIGDYVEITDAGERYADPKHYFHNTEKKASLGNTVPEHQTKYQYLETNKYYSPAKGHVGKVVHLFKSNDRDIAIVNIDENNIVIGTNGFKTSSKSAYDSFLKRITKKKHKFYDVELGVTTYNEAVREWDNLGISFEKQWVYESPKLRVLFTKEHPNMPVIEKQQAKDLSLYFVDDVLYSIFVDFGPKKAGGIEENNFRTLGLDEHIKDGLRHKYLEYGIEGNKYAFQYEGNAHHLWLNNSETISVERRSKAIVRLKYNHSTLTDKAFDYMARLNLEMIKQRLQSNSDSL